MFLRPPEVVDKTIVLFRSTIIEVDTIFFSIRAGILLNVHSFRIFIFMFIVVVVKYQTTYYFFFFFYTTS